MNEPTIEVTQPTAPPPIGEIHIYAGRLDHDEATVERFTALLSPAERLLAKRRVTPELRRRAILSRGFLRAALGASLERAPVEITLNLGKHGKPFFLEPDDAALLDFNVTHSGDLWLCALTATGPVGIDIETPRDETDWNALVERYFSEAEGQAFAALPENRKKEAFFRTWVTKEAFLKARGSGLTTPLRDFDVEVNPDAPVALLAVRIPEEHVEAWWCLEVTGCGAPAVVAGRGTKPKVLLATLDPS